MINNITIVGQATHNIAVNPNTNKIYVTNYNNVSIIDGKRDELINATIPSRDSLDMIVVNPVTDLIYVINNSHYLNNSTISISMGTKDELIKNNAIPLSDFPTDIAVNPGIQIRFM